jgi:serine/threonine protein kinase/formylglycine-generating enzyme required for sulfatase activity
VSEEPTTRVSARASQRVRRIDEVCDGFESALRGGTSPRIEDALSAAPEPDRAELLAELLILELEYRRRTGDRPTPEDYRLRFPGQDAVIDSAFAALTVTFVQKVPTAERPSAPGGLTPTGERFRRHRWLAEGGLGVVYVAHDQELHREVALKEIQESQADDPERQAKFLMEAELTGRLEHPGIVPVYSLGLYASGRPYYAMRLVRGETLSEAIARFHRREQGDPGERALELRRLLGRLVAVCDAVAYAHSRGVLHRDLKPSNILLGKYGETLVVDWGLAKMIPSTGGVGSPDEPAIQTVLAAAVDDLPGGTPQFMSPEQAADDVDGLGAASDTYSLGATLYSILIGRAPFNEPRTRAESVVLLDRVRAGSFPTPREVNRAISPALESVCLKAMALRPEERYASPRALADDLERWLADEPVSAWHEPWPIKLSRWLSRHRTAASSAVVALVAILVAVGYLAYDARLRDAGRRSQADGLVLAIESAEASKLPQILEQLGPIRELARPRLESLAAALTPDGSSPNRRSARAALALLPVDPSRSRALAREILRPETEADELIVIRQGLQHHRHGEVLTPEFWSVLGGEGTRLSDTQLRAAAALALMDGNHRRWATLGAAVAAKLVRENPLRIGLWREAFQPVSATLKEPLHAFYADHARPAERASAYTLLFGFATDPGNLSQPEDLAELIADADPPQYRQVRDQLRDPEYRRRALARLVPQVASPARFDEALAVRQGRVAAALVALGHPEAAWPLLRQKRGDRSDPSVRTELLHDLAKFDADPGVVIERFRFERDVSARRALLLALGGYPIEQIPLGEQRALTAVLRDAFATDPDPGLHSAIDWLLRVCWDQAEDLERIERQPLMPNPPSSRDWYVTSQGHTMAIVRHPGDFVMGSPPDEAGRDADEAQHRVHIGRSFAIATRKVTVAQYTAYLDRHPGALRLDQQKDVRNYAPTSGCPIIKVDWYDAARYCNWLSLQERIPKGQWCYPEDIRPGVRLSRDYLARRGYRLPTDAEWEYACRAGSAASRFYGGSVAWLPSYSWFADNAGKCAHPVGMLKPNDLGLFDILGNCFDWTQDPFGGPGRVGLASRGVPGVGPDVVATDTTLALYGGPYQGGLDGKTFPDAEVDVPVSDDSFRLVRGCSFFFPASALSCAGRDALHPSARNYSVGFRVARTVD